MKKNDTTILRASICSQMSSRLQVYHTDSHAARALRGRGHGETRMKARAGTGSTAAASAVLLNASPGLPLQTPIRLYIRNSYANLYLMTRFLKNADLGLL